MCAKVLGLLLFTCQIILNGCSVIDESSESVSVEDEPRPVTQTSGLPEGYVAFPDVNAAYKLHETESSWTEGRDACVAEGARLAIADSVAKIQHINSLKSNQDSDKWVHVGIRHLNATDEWVQDVDGKVLTAIPWIANNPDGTGECTGISISEEGLVDYRCDWSGEHYACEIPL